MKKLKKYLFEFIVIVTGITTSFLVDEWREDRNDRAREQMYLRSLLSDVKKFKTDLIAIHEHELSRGLKNINTILNYNGVYNDSLLVTSFSIYYYKNTNMRLNTFETLKTTGDLRLIKNNNLAPLIYQILDKFDYLNIIFQEERQGFLERLVPLMHKYKFATLGNEWLNQTYFGDSVKIAPTNQAVIKTVFNELIANRDYIDILFDLRMSNRYESKEIISLAKKLDSLEQTLTTEITD